MITFTIVIVPWIGIWTSWWELAW